MGYARTKYETQADRSIIAAQAMLKSAWHYLAKAQAATVADRKVNPVHDHHSNDLRLRALADAMSHADAAQARIAHHLPPEAGGD